MEAQDRFIASWGQMGSTWGISRTMAEVHALLYISGQALCTDDVMDRLAISRGNASMSMRALLDWGIVSRVHKRGDRKEYFQAEQDVWTLLQAVVRERMKREIQPVLQSLHEIRDMAARAGGDETALEHQVRLDSMIGLIGTIEALGEKLVEMPGEQLRQTASTLSGAEA